MKFRMRIVAMRIAVALLHPVSRLVVSILLAALVLAVAPGWAGITIATVALALVIEAVVTGTLLQAYQRRQAIRESTRPAPELTPELIAYFARVSAAWKN